MTLDHKTRSKGIGSSEIAMLLGISPWGGPHTLWRRKTKREDDKQTPIMRRGQFIERAILDWYSAETGATLEYPGTMRHPEYHWVVDSVDAINPDEATVEAKTVHWSRHGDWDDGVPAYYEAQCQWHMGCHGLPRCDVPIDTGTDFELHSVDFNADLFANMVEIARKFWFEHVEPEIEPPLDEDKGTSSWMNANRKQRTDKIRIATDDEVALMMRLREIKLTQKEAAAIEVRLKEAIGEDDGLNINGTGAVVTWRAQTNGKRVLRTTRLVQEDL